VLPQPKSIRQTDMIFPVKQEKGELKGSVSGYAQVVILKGIPTDPLFVKVSEASRLRVFEKWQKNVYSVITGSIVDAYAMVCCSNVYCF
jgi:hypothetical protein